MKMPKSRPDFVEDIHEINCNDRFIYKRGLEWKVAYLHYSDGAMIYEQAPNHRNGWNRMYIMVGEKISPWQ